MLEKYNYEGKNKEELLETIEKELETKLEDLFLNEIETEAKLFKSKKIKIEVIKKSDLIKYIKNYLKELQELFGLTINSEVTLKNDSLNVILVSDNNAILIGKDGRTLASIQLLIKQLVKKLLSTNYRVNVDVGGYKSKKISTLEYQMKLIAKDVLRTKVEVKLDPMNSYERRIVHSVISEYLDLETKSEGLEPERYIVVRYKNKEN